MTSCVTKAPAARWQRMQKIIMELKLLTVAARRADKPAVARGASDSALRAEMQQMEARISGRLATYEKSISDVQKTAGDAVASVKEQLTGLHRELAAVREQPVQHNVDTDALMQQINGRVQESIEAVTKQLRAHVLEAVGAAAQQHGAQVQEIIATAAKQTGEKANETLAAANQRMAAAEQNMEEIRKHFATLQENVAWRSP